MFRQFPTALMIVCIVLVLPSLRASGQTQDQEWLVVWNGQDRPGPINLPFTTGWPVDEAGFEQHDPNGCYDQPPGPDYAEAANVDTGGWWAIENLLDGSCNNIGHIDGGACIAQYSLLQIRESPCGMRYQVGPRTVLNWFNNYNSEIMAYHGPDTTETLTTGLTAEMSFYIAQSPQFTWTTLLEIEGYPKYDNPWNTGGGDYHLNSYAQVLLRHWMTGRPTDEWHLVAAADNTFSLGKVEDMLNRWITVRLGLGGVPGKPQMTVWVDGILHHEAGWDAQGLGNDNGADPHGYCRFGFKETDGDVRIGTMAFTNQGVFSPNPRGQCRDYFGTKYLRHLPSIAGTRTHPEICDNGVDDDGDGLADCDDQDCFQKDACENLLVNGSFEQPISVCEPMDCGVFDPRPTGWDSTGSGTVVTQGDQWAPVPAATEGSTRGSISSSGGSSAAYQSVLVVGGTQVTLKGDIATGHSSGMSFEHFAELVDGDETSSTIIDRFVQTNSTTSFEPFLLSGTCTSGMVTVRWGYKAVSGGGPVTTHVDNLHLAGTPRGRCNDPFADADGDGDVDQSDFAVWQTCYTGSGTGPVAPVCECFDVQGAGDSPDGDLDQNDFVWFLACASGPSVPVDEECDDDVTPSPIQIVSAVSRRTHGTVGNFDLDIRAGSAVESRNGGPQHIYVTFDEFVQAADGSFDIGDEVSASVGTITNATLACEQLAIDLAGVPDESCLAITLHGLALLSDPAAVMPDRQLLVAVLMGDANGDGTVDSADVSDINASSGQTPSATTFRKDIDTSGLIDWIDALVAGTAQGNSASCP